MKTEHIVGIVFIVFILSSILNVKVLLKGDFGGTLPLLVEDDNVLNDDNLAHEELTSTTIKDSSSKVTIDAEPIQNGGLIEHLFQSNEGPSIVPEAETPTNLGNMHKYNKSEYAIQVKKAMEPLPDLATCAYLHVFWSGFCNQYYMFSGVLLMAETSNYTQILVHSIRWKDLFGTNQVLRHDVFFDVVHWNSYYPSLPRFVDYNRSLFPELDIPDPNDVKSALNWNISDPFSNATKPFALGRKRTDAIMNFYDYTKNVDKGISERKHSELLMMRGALRPHPAIQDIINTFKRANNMTNIMVLHARIEPDMQKHPMYKELKVLNISDIVEMLYEKYSEPPVSTVLVILNRSILEKEVANPKNENAVATHNLKVLNKIVSSGLWNGRVKVVEAGSELAKRSEYPTYSKYCSLVGSIINFFLALDAEIFVGTIVSSYSTAVISYRFFREKKENFFYSPRGLDWVTPPDIKQPPRFAC